MCTLKNPAELFLTDYLELQSMTPNKDDWQEKLLATNPPRYYRLLRMKACLKALGIEVKNWQQLPNQFIRYTIPNRAKKKLELLLEKQFELDYDSYITDRDNFNAGSMFSMLLSIRVATFELNMINNSVLAASDHYVTPLKVIEKLNEKLKKDNEVLDTVIGCLLNPDAIQLTIQELVTCYDYPDVDLAEIDLEWI